MTMISATTTVDEGNWKTTTLAETVLGWKRIFVGAGSSNTLNAAPNIIVYTQMTVLICPWISGSVFMSPWSYRFGLGPWKIKLGHCWANQLLGILDLLCLDCLGMPMSVIMGHCSENQILGILDMPCLDGHVRPILHQIIGCQRMRSEGWLRHIECWAHLRSGHCWDMHGLGTLNLLCIGCHFRPM